MPWNTFAKPVSTETKKGTVETSKQGGHKIYVHDGLPEFKSASYNCGHGRNPEIKPAYIRNVLRILRQHEAEIVNYLEKRK